MRGKAFMKWVKHFTNAHKGSVLQELYAEFGVNQGHGLYWRFIEYVGDKWDGCSEPKFKLLESELRKFLGLSRKSFETFRKVFGKVSGNKFEISGEFCEIELPKLLEVRHRDALSSGHRPEKLQPNSSGEEEEKRREEKKRRISSFATFLNKISLITQDQWNTKFGKEFVLEHGAEAFSFYSNDPSSATWPMMTWVSKIGSSLERQRVRAKEKADERVGYISGVVPD
jgi:hypothetical protein